MALTMIQIEEMTRITERFEEWATTYGESLSLKKNIINGVPNYETQIVQALFNAFFRGYEYAVNMKDNDSHTDEKTNLSLGDFIMRMNDRLTGEVVDVFFDKKGVKRYHIKFYEKNLTAFCAREDLHFIHE